MQAVDGRGMFGLSYDVERPSFVGCSSIHAHTRLYSLSRANWSHPQSVRGDQLWQSLVP